ncbi:hypothetical protein ACVIDN_005230 [Rhizobium brockwellii]
MSGYGQIAAATADRATTKDPERTTKAVSPDILKEFKGM